LYYTTGQYQTAIDHCTLVTRSQDHSQCSSHVVQGELLPKIDEDIDSVLGLAVFYQYVVSAALNQQQTQYVSVFTTELFARYLHIRCLSVINCHETTQASLPDEIQRYKQCLSESAELTTTDVLALKFTSCIECRTSDVTSLVQVLPPELVELLQKSAIEHLTKFCQLEAQHFGSADVIDFEALYAYKHGQYQRCLQLSRQKVGTVVGHPFPSLTPGMFYPEFTQLMDDDIISVHALTLIVNPSRRERIGCVLLNPLSLSLYLMVKCQMQLHHPVTSLAQTFDYIQVELRFHRDLQLPNYFDLPLPVSVDLLILKLAERIVLKCICN